MVRSDLDTSSQVCLTRMPNNAIRVEVAIEIIAAAAATPVKQTGDEDDNEYSNATGHSTDNSTSIAAAAAAATSRTRCGRQDDNRGADGSGDYRAIWFRCPERISIRGTAAMKYKSIHHRRRQYGR